ncbi:FtsX-like permease family protein [Candidatus Bathyarchaeota archaeon]|nr:MAG: FtsX-like permease family protein [Candidatus Bathyarchaeota archaeon]
MTSFSLIRFTARGIGRRPVRTTLTIIGLAALILTYVSVQSLVSTLEINVSGSVSSLGGEIDVLKKGASFPLFSTVPVSYTNTVKTISGVSLAAPVAVAQMTVDNNQAVIAGLVPSLVPRMLTYTMVAGTMITSNQSGILSIGKALASTVGKGAGQTLLLDGYNYSIAGVYQTNAWMDYSLIIPHSVAQQLIGWVNQTSMIVVTTQDPRTVDTIIGQIRTLLPTTDAFRTSEAPSKISPIFASLEAIASDITIIVSLSAVLGIMNSNLNNLRERMRTFAIFKATGASSSQIIRLVLYESLLIGILGTMLGLGISYAVLNLVSIPVAEKINVAIILVPSTFIYATLLAISVSLAAAIYPALRIARVRPQEVFRFG